VIEDTQVKRAVIMVGVPASGKSTVAKQIAKDLDLVFVSSDEVVKTDENGSRIYNRDTLRESWLQVWTTIGSCVLQGKSFLLDATLVTEERRSPVIGLALGAGYEVTAVFLNTRPETCLIRNSLREHRVPESTLLRMAANLEAPQTEEGWTTIYRLDPGPTVKCWGKNEEGDCDKPLHVSVSTVGTHNYTNLVCNC
jgi:predicted kinase